NKDIQGCINCMKQSHEKISFFLLVTIAILFSCSKSKTQAKTINCDGLITDTLSTNDSGRIYMPNAFTPNGDGLNDIIYPFAWNINSIEFTIYDEDNNIVFTTTQLHNVWQPIPNPVVNTKYYYRIQATTTTNHKIGLCGDLYMLSCMPKNAPVLYFEDQLSVNGFTVPTAEVLGTCP
ncbi:gliding motility-associated C-terminal domain-containing protein, partial [Parasediminibacterium sp. JCM 36343]|uniref:T9SS type B sorting domain-containing protein n=1 Tax=Parasediminibacterium sp. JCM 36343 TaxID=3374279 RepID=UPI00397CE868